MDDKEIVEETTHDELMKDVEPKEKTTQNESKPLLYVEKEELKEDELESLVSVEQQNEDMGESTQDKIDEENQDRLRIVLPTLTPKQLEDKLEKVLKDKDNFKKMSEKVGSLENNLLRMIEVFSDQFNLLNDILGKLPDTIKNTYEDEEASIKIKDSYPEINKDFNGKELTGKEAKIYILANKRNVKKVLLANSGFYVLLQSPSLSDLTIMYNKISDQLGEYGRMFGTYFYLYSDLYIKQIMIEMISKLVISSNLVGWQKGKNLIKHVSIHDYSVLLHGIATLMFKDGYEFKYQCPNDDYSENLKIDLNKLKYYNFNKISEENLKFLSSSESKTSKEVFKYQKELDFNETIRIDSYNFHLKIPSINEYFVYGDDYNKSLMEMVQDGNTEEIKNYLRFSYFKIFTPWIDSIDVLKDDGQVNFKLSDIDGKCLILDNLQIANTSKLDKILDPIIAFIKNTTLTHIVIPINPCPKCNNIPESLIKGFLPLDMQESFFSMSTMRLIL